MNRLCAVNRQGTLQMFTGVYRVIKGLFYNICRENPVMFTDCREIPADIAEKALNTPVNICIVGYKLARTGKKGRK